MDRVCVPEDVSADRVLVPVCEELFGRVFMPVLGTCCADTCCVETACESFVFVTVTLQVAFFPLTVLTVIVAVPFFLAVIFPVFDTATTLLLLEDQDRAFLPA